MTPDVLLTRLAQSLRVFVAGFKDDPGTSDLDDEQVIHLRVTLGDWRRARYLVWYIDNTPPDPLRRECVVPIDPKGDRCDPKNLKIVPLEGK
jgi:hypothetical protein